MMCRYEFITDIAHHSLLFIKEVASVQKYFRLRKSR